MDTIPLPADLATPKVAARLLRCHLATVYRFLLSGNPTGYKRGGRWYVSLADVRRLFVRHDAGTPPPRPAA
jgi:hypothetical protein